MESQMIKNKIIRFIKEDINDGVPMSYNFRWMNRFDIVQEDLK